MNRSLTLRKNMRALLAAVAFFIGSSALALDVDWKLYMRTPVGTNAQGGKLIQVRNPKSQGNEFRLGNETTYAEAYFTGHLLKPEKDKPFFDANMTFAYNPQMNSQYGDTTTNTDYTQVIQAFVSGGRFDDMHFSAWAGKRFYRDVDIHMDDFYYFADMSGVGGGFEEISLGNGTLAIALLQHSDNTLQKTTNGVPSKQALDLRWRALKLTQEDSLHLWAAAAYSAPGTGFKLDTTTGLYTIRTDYEAGHGFAGGARYQHDFSEKSFNNVAVMYGTGQMENLTMDNSMAYAENGTHINDRKRLRVVENPVVELNDHLGLSMAFVYEDVDKGLNGDRERWYSAGVRPIYYFSDHYHLAFEVGYSSVNDSSETGAGGARAGERTLTRVTIAPEIALTKGFLARPVIRAFATYSRWNTANADTTNASSLIGSLNGQNINALDGRRDETQFGVEAEVWF